MTLAGDGAGNVYYGTAAGGLYHFRDGKPAPLAKAYQFGSSIKGLVTTKNNGVFIGAELGAVQMKSDGLFRKTSFRGIEENFDFELTAAHRQYLIEMKIPYANQSDNVKDFVWDEASQRLWVTNYYLTYYDFPKTGRPKAGLVVMPKMDALALGKNNEIWTGGTSGLWLVKDNKAVELKNRPEELTRKVTDLACDRHGIVWVGTDGFGLYGYKDGRVYKVPDTRGDFITCVYRDPEGFLWAGTDKGVKQFAIDPNDFSSQKLVRTYTVNDGLPANETRAIYVDAAYLYFGTSKGLARIDRAGKFKDESLPKIIIEAIKIKGKPRGLATEFELSYRENELEISFVGLSYKSMGDIDYWYQLENADDTLILTQNTSVRYPDLRPGTYVFRVKAVDIEGREKELATPLRFTISPPFWETAWFRLLAILAIGGLAYLFYRFRVNAVREKEAERGQINKKFAELELQALQAQMNPHFVFNSLASIQSFIQDHEIDLADDYLAKFAKLMRLFLDSSKTKFIHLSTELKLLHLYVDLEQMRFVDRFEVDFRVAEDIDPAQIMVPTLLLQPFVENAINHGLFHKDGKGKLSIDFSMAGEGALVCTIQDDGIGRKAAKTIHEKSIRGYESRATQIVNERLEVLKKADDYNIDIEMEDLYDDAQHSLGTRVCVKIPLID